MVIILGNHFILNLTRVSDNSILTSEQYVFATSILSFNSRISFCLGTIPNSLKTQSVITGLATVTGKRYSFSLSQGPLAVTATEAVFEAIGETPISISDFFLSHVILTPSYLSIFRAELTEQN